MGSTFVQSIVLLTDSSFLSRYDTLAFDAAGNAGLIYITMFMAISGLSDGSQILMARRIGEKRERLLSGIFASSIFINFAMVLILFTCIKLFVPDMVLSYSEHDDLALLQIKFIEIRGYALFFIMISLAINAYFMATGRTRVVLYSAIITAVSNILLDYALISGKMGFPEWGLEGAAYASTFADGIGMLYLLGALANNPLRRKHRLLHHLRLNFTAINTLIKVGSPVVLQGIIALSTWTIFFIWIEQRGKYELTISQNIRSIYFLAFVPLFGFAATTKTYVGQYIGSKNFDAIKIIQRRIQFLTILFLLVFFHGAILYPETLVSLINPKEIYLEDSAAILRFIAGSILMYGVFSVYFQTINGSGNTRVTLFIEILSVFVYLISAYLLIKIFDVNIQWIWSVEYIYFGVMGLLSLAYLRLFNWKKKQI